MVKRPDDQERFAQTKDKWMQSYEALLRELFGIPSPGEIERLLEPWRSLMVSFAGNGNGSSSHFASMGEPVGWAVPGVGQKLFPLWWDTYENTLGKMFRLPGCGLSREYEQRAKEAVDAQIKFLMMLPRFHEQVLIASKAAADKAVSHIVDMEIERVTPETSWSKGDEIKISDTGW